MTYLLFNPKANNSKGADDAKSWAEANGVQCEFVDITGIEDIRSFFEGLAADDEVILTGGDGTINRFANDMYGYDFRNPLWYVKCGSGNDFFNDVKDAAGPDGKIELAPYMKNLPLVTVNGIKRRFVNGIGYGLDGDTCKYGDIQRATSDKPVNYTSIAIKLLLGKYKLKKATVTVDGDTAKYENVWLAPTMKGRFYGGGMMVAPGQNRLDPDGRVTSVVLYKKSRLITLMRFPSIFKGEHINYKGWITVKTGKHTKVVFNEPCALQIDGDVIDNVLEYEVDTDA